MKLTHEKAIIGMVMRAMKINCVEIYYVGYNDSENKYYIKKWLMVTVWLKW